MITLLQCMLIWRNMYEIKLESEQLVLCGGKTENISFYESQKGILVQCVYKELVTFLLSTDFLK